MGDQAYGESWTSEAAHISRSSALRLQCGALQWGCCRDGGTGAVSDLRE